MILLHRPSTDELLRYLDAQADSTLSYVGPSVEDDFAPRGYKLAKHFFVVGHGIAAFERARASVMSWQVFGHSWLQLFAATKPPDVGKNVAFRIDGPGVTILNACRVTEVCDQESGTGRTYSFTYATLPDHMVRGIERFEITWRGCDDAVTYTICAYFQAHHLLFKLGYPFARWLQHTAGHIAVHTMAERIRNEEDN